MPDTELPMRALTLLSIALTGLVLMGTNCTQPTRCFVADGGQPPLCEVGANGLEVAVNCTGGGYEIPTECDAGTRCVAGEVAECLPR